MSMKNCMNCRETKEVSSFTKDRSRPDGLNVYCRKCKKERGKNYYQKNCKGNEQFLQKKAKQSRDNWKRIKADPILHENRKEYKREHKKDLTWDNLTEYQRTLKNLRTVLSTAVRGKRWGPSYNKVFGCYDWQFLDHLSYYFDDTMSFDNYGSHWEIHHIVPASFAKGDLDILLLLFNFQNLVPISKERNQELGATVDPKLLNEWHGSIPLDF